MANWPKRAARIVPLSCAWGGARHIDHFFAVRPRHQTQGNGTGAPGAWTTLCRAPNGTTHGKGHSPPCAMDQPLTCAAPLDARQRVRSTVRLDHSLSCAEPRGARQRVPPFPCVLRRTVERVWRRLPADGRQHLSLSCVSYYARQRTVSCVAFSQSARQRSLPGKNALSALCRALSQNAHDKGCVVRILVFAVRRARIR
jgi:hypothetical protein